VLASDRVAWAVKVDRRLVGKQRSLVVSRLSTVTHIPIAQINRRIKDQRQSPFEPAVVAIGKTEVTDRVRLAILERQENFPHVSVQIVPYRYYPAGQLAAHVLGYVGKVSGPTEAKKHRGYEDNDTIGRAGVEATYDTYLHGIARTDKVAVDPAGRVVGDPTLVSAGKPGDNVELTIDANVQRVAEQSLAQGIALARTEQNKNIKRGFEQYNAPGGAVVVLDADTGGVVAMASNPTYSPAEFVGGITQAQYKALTAPPARLINRATQGLYAVGSTFKLVSSVAAIRYNYRGEFTTVQDNGFIETQDHTRYKNANGEVHGTVDLRKALTVSSDVYFYTFGNQMWDTWKAGDLTRGYAIQNVARQFGFGAKTGIPLDEAIGRVPDAKWKKAFAKKLYSDPQQQTENGNWNPGDDIELAVGQGDLVATPLQLANAYAAYDNGGTLYQPQVVSRVVDPVTHKVVFTVKPKVIRRIPLDPQLRSALSDGFSGVVNDPLGTAYDAFHGAHPFPLAQYPVSGKTGTAEVVINKAGDISEHSVFVGMVTVKGHRYVVVSLVEQGGFGAKISAPIVRRVIESIAGIKPLSTIEKAQGAD
jgi:penicillin-binding protein 2